MSHADEVPDVDVAREDQMRINLFGRLNNKKHFIEDTIKDIKVSHINTHIYYITLGLAWPAGPAVG